MCWYIVHPVALIQRHLARSTRTCRPLLKSHFLFKKHNALKRFEGSSSGSTYSVGKGDVDTQIGISFRAAPASFIHAC